jgi:hypothetical protein
MVVGGSAVGCHGPTIASIPLDGVNSSAEAPLTLHEGMRLEFGITYGAYHLMKPGDLMLDVALLEDGAEVETLRCRVQRRRTGGEKGSSGSSYHSTACKMRVPAGGASAIRVSTQLDEGECHYENLAVVVHHDD